MKTLQRTIERESTVIDVPALQTFLKAVKPFSCRTLDMFTIGTAANGHHYIEYMHRQGAVRMRVNSVCPVPVAFSLACLQDFAKGLKKGTLEIIREGSNVRLVHEDSTTLVPCLDAIYKGSAHLHSPKLFYFNKFWDSGIEKIINPDGIRSYSTVVRFEIGEKIRLIGTDGFRLSYSESEPRGYMPEDFQLPAKAFKSLSVLAQKHAESEYALSECKTLLRVITPGSAFVAEYPISTIKYPAYAGVIPQNMGRKFSFDRKKFLQLLTYCKGKTGKDRGIFVQVKDEKLHLHIDNLDINLKSNLYHPMPGAVDTPRVLVNCTFLIDALNASKESTGTFEIRENEEPATVVLGNNTTIIVPMRVDTPKDKKK